MGKIVNRTLEVASEWQRQIVWLRMNIAYIKAELPHLAEVKDDPTDIEPVLAAFGAPYARFCDAEFDVFVLARRAEGDVASRAALVARLGHLCEVFRAWVQEYHELVLKAREVACGSLKEILLNGCGAEIHRSHGAFITIVDNYVAELQQ